MWLWWITIIDVSSLVADRSHGGGMTPHNNFSRFEEGVPQCETTHKQQNDIIVETTTCTTIRGIKK